MTRHTSRTIALAALAALAVPGVAQAEQDCAITSHAGTPLLVWKADVRPFPGARYRPIAWLAPGRDTSGAHSDVAASKAASGSTFTRVWPYARVPVRTFSLYRRHTSYLLTASYVEDRSHYVSPDPATVVFVTDRCERTVTRTARTR